ncbi:MAG: hypothetical protein K2M17_00300 [Bacilli bacterium]|nr:hypothetical protein [Bacilli bacterium]
MPKFKNNKTGKVIEVDLLYYVNLLRSNPDFNEIKEIKEIKEVKKKIKEEVEESTTLQ